MREEVEFGGEDQEPLPLSPNPNSSPGSSEGKERKNASNSMESEDSKDSKKGTESEVNEGGRESKCQERRIIVKEFIEGREARRRGHARVEEEGRNE